MAGPCSGEQLIEMLMKELECKNISELGKRIGKGSNIQAWKRSEFLSKTIIKNVISAVKKEAIRNSIKPIMEFHRLDHLHGNSKDTLRKKLNNKEICNKLSNSHGIYSYYDSNGKIIYVGKTEKSDLFTEMNQSFGLSRNNYTRKTVDNGKFKIIKLCIKDSAYYASAYSVDQNVIGNVEALLTRMIPNDVVNKRTENFKW